VRYPRRVTYCLITVLALVTVLFRYPVGIDHEMGSDTTFIHSLTDSLIARGSAAWILHPLSYFGLYALSYPSAMPFLFGSVSIAGDITVEGVILLTGLVFAIVGTFSAFVASRAAKDDDRLALIVALLFSMGPFYIKDTAWVGSSRGFVTALVPIIFYFLLRKPSFHRICAKHIQWRFQTSEFSKNSEVSRSDWRVPPSRTYPRGHQLASVV